VQEADEGCDVGTCRRYAPPPPENNTTPGIGCDGSFNHRKPSPSLFLLLGLRCCALVLPISTMVVIVDMDDTHAPHASSKPVHHSLSAAIPVARVSEEAARQRPNPNVNGFSAALSCYP